MAGEEGIAGGSGSNIAKWAGGRNAKRTWGGESVAEDNWGSGTSAGMVAKNCTGLGKIRKYTSPGTLFLGSRRLFYLHEGRRYQGNCSRVR